MSWMHLLTLSAALWIHGVWAAAADHWIFEGADCGNQTAALVIPTYVRLTTSQTFPLRAISQSTDPTATPEKLTQFPRLHSTGIQFQMSRRETISDERYGKIWKVVLPRTPPLVPLKTFWFTCNNVIGRRPQTERVVYQPNRAEITSAPPAGPVDWAVQRDAWWKEEKQAAVYPSVYTSSVPCFCYLKLGPECICLTAV